MSSNQHSSPEQTRPIWGYIAGDVSRLEAEEALLDVDRLIEQLEASQETLAKIRAAAERQVEGEYQPGWLSCSWVIDVIDDPNPASEPHEHEWSLPVNAGVFRCMTCGVETTNIRDSTLGHGVSFQDTRQEGK